jgi:hypothetical protein
MTTQLFVDKLSLVSPLTAALFGGPAAVRARPRQLRALPFSIGTNFVRWFCMGAQALNI